MILFHISTIILCMAQKKNTKKTASQAESKPAETPEKPAKTSSSRVPAYTR